MCERLGNFWSLHRIYIAFWTLFSPAMDKIELKMKHPSCFVIVDVLRWAGETFDFYDATFCSRLARTFVIFDTNKINLIMTAISGRPESSKNLRNNGKESSNQRERNAGDTIDECDHTKCWRGWCFQGNWSFWAALVVATFSFAFSFSDSKSTIWETLKL